MKFHLPISVKKIVLALEDKKGLDLLVLDVRDVVSYTDYLIICSGTSTTHVKALVDGVKKAFAKQDGPVYVSPSKDDSWWILDFVEVVVHVFRENEREYYGLESLWGDAQKIGEF